MTKLLEKAIDSVRALTPAEQDAIAQIMLDEIESDRLWELAVAKSPEKMRRLADDAWRDFESGKTEPLDPDAL